MKTILIMGSTFDEPHAKKITDKLDEYNIPWEQHAASAHKQPLKVLEILESNKDEKDIIYITIAGRSNALSGLLLQILSSLHWGVLLFLINLTC